MTEAKVIAVVGAGTMGHGIAQVAAAAGFSTSLHDSQPSALDRARARIDENLRGAIDRGKIREEDRSRVHNNLRFEADLADAVRDADLVIEAIVERLEAKRELFARLETLAPSQAILATNTSSLPVGKIATAVRNPERVVGMHFFNPAPIMKLVEIVVHAGTSETARETVLAAARRMDKEPIVVKDSPGFASSRLGVVLGLEAMRMVEQGVASPEDIDKAMELGYKHPMGPLRLTDLVGLDVRLAIAETLHRELGGEQYRPPEILRRKVAAGELGKKSGRGFYAW